MTDRSSRRRFLESAAGLAVALPVAGTAARASAAEAKPPGFPKIRRRILGRTGLSVTELGAGCEAVSDVAVLQRAVELGINFFDTARAYEAGNNERFLKAALGAHRKDVVLSTRSYAKDAKQLDADLDASLAALGVPQIDLWYIGNKNDPSEVTDEMLEVQRKAQQAGKIRFRALSTHVPSRMMELVLQRGKFDVVQIPYNFAIGTRRDPMKIPSTDLDASLTQLASAGVGVVAMKVMAGGYGGRKANDPLYGTYQQPGAHGAAIRWALRDARVQTTSVRMVDVEQLEENVRAMAQSCSPADEQLLAARADAIAPRYCRMCGACEGACPSGADVATLVRCVSYVDGYGSFAIGADRWSRLEPRQRDVRCGECASCSVRCPNGVRVREQLLRARELFA
jgi:predicted aldo/keto reductase-like oxidoreductase